MPKCLSCFEPVYADGRCIHRQRYLDLLEYVISRGIIVEQPDREDFSWKPADSFAIGFERYIRISSIGYRQYGWDVMTSVLVHEFGHCDLFTEGIAENPSASWEEKLQLELAANERGLRITPVHLVSADYKKHREFFLRAYLDHGWCKEECLNQWAAFQEALWNT
jgi:hypothetical protein